MTLGSLFDGSGGFPLAGLMCGIEPKWLAEIEPYPCRVTAARFPGIPNHGDVTKINGAKVEPVDIITFGSPCQDLSVAGKQAGIHEGERSNLFFEAIRIIKEMRDATADKFPRFAVWENVPGAFSSNDGRDFQAVLEAFCGVKSGGSVTVPFPQGGKWQPAGCILGDGYSVAWRVYDAQYWGVPQRRKRIYLVADFAGERAGEILFKPDSVQRDSEAGGTAGEGTADDAEGSAGGSDQVKCLNPWDPEGKRIFRTDGAMQTLFAGEGGGGHLRGVCYSIEGHVVDRNTAQNGRGWAENYAHCPNATDRHAVAFMGGQGANARSIAWKEDGKSPTLRATESGSNQVPDVCYAVDCRNLYLNREKSATLQAKNEGGFSLNFINPVVYPDKARSLCARGDSSPCLDRGQNIVVYDARKNGDGKIAPTLTGDHENRLTDYTAPSCYRNSWQGYWLESEQFETLAATPASQYQNLVVSIGNGQIKQIGMKPVARCLDTMHDQQIVCYTQPAFGDFRQDETAQALKASDMKRVDPGAVVLEEGKPPRKYIVRRLTPIECCRLQGFPDWWMDGVEGSDSAKYKLWGNGIALPCAYDVLRRIAEEVNVHVQCETT